MPHQVPWIQAPGPVPLHADHLGNPTGCNAFCQPAHDVHAQLSYSLDPTDLDTPGEIVQTVHGEAKVLSCRLATEAPPCPTLPHHVPILTIYAYVTDPHNHPYTPTSPP